MYFPGAQAPAVGGVVGVNDPNYQVCVLTTFAQYLRTLWARHYHLSPLSFNSGVINSIVSASLRSIRGENSNDKQNIDVCRVNGHNGPGSV